MQCQHNFRKSFSPHLVFLVILSNYLLRVQLLYILAWCYFIIYAMPDPENRSISPSSKTCLYMTHGIYGPNQQRIYRKKKFFIIMFFIFIWKYIASNIATYQRANQWSMNEWIIDQNSKFKIQHYSQQINWNIVIHNKDEQFK